MRMLKYCSNLSIYLALIPTMVMVPIGSNMVGKSTTSKNIQNKSKTTTKSIIATKSSQKNLKQIYLKTYKCHKELF